MDHLVLIGVVLVGLVSFARFNQVPPPYHFWCRRASLAKTVQAWFKLDTPLYLVFPPPRANTTPFKYWINRLGYTMVGVGIYLAIVEIDGLAAQTRLIIESLATDEDGAMSDNVAILLDAGPITSAFVIGVLLPMLPLFKTADLYIRSMLYESASIPAKRFRDVWRLKHADYEVKDEVLDNIRLKLVAEGFDAADIRYEPGSPTSYSLWTKIASLMRTCSIWSIDDCYKTAFSILMDCEENITSFDKLNAQYDALKSEAKTCFKELKLPPSDSTIVRDEAFQMNCKGLLCNIYDFLSRASLHSHYSEEERIKSLRKSGFMLQDKRKVLPDTNDLIMLILVLSAVLIIPLALFLGISKALIIGTVVYSAILMPIYLVHRYPVLQSKTTRYHLPDIRLPVASAISAMLFGLIVIVCYRFVSNSFNIQLAWDMYASRHPWSFIHGTVAFMIAWRMQTGRYPDVSKQQGWQTIKAWGDLKDAVIISSVNLLVLMVLVIPKLEALGSAPSSVTRTLIILTMMSFCIGFIVPTWYRAKLREKQGERRVSSVDRERYSNKYHGAYVLMEIDN